MVDLDTNLVSTVIPAYNAESFLSDAVNSIFAQSHKPQEIIIINDGSNDSTLEVANDLSTRAPKGIDLIIIDIKKNAGAANALKTGFAKAKGDYICWLSADDMFLESNKLQTQLDFMVKTKAALSFFKGYHVGQTLSMTRLVKARYLIGRGWWLLDPVINNSAPLRAMMLIFRNPINGSSVMIGKECLTRWGCFDPVLMNVDADCDLWMRYSLLGLKFTPINGSPIFYREHANQTSKDTKSMLYGTEITRMRLLNFLSESGRLRQLLKKFSPFLIPILLNKNYLSCPISSIYISDYILDNGNDFNPATARCARKIVRDAERCLKEIHLVNANQFSRDLCKVSNSAEFKSFKELMANRL